MEKDEKKNKKNEQEEKSEEFVPEEDLVIDEGVEMPEVKKKLDKLREKLKKCETERQEYLDGWQRARADAINSRKRDEETAKLLVRFANEDLISQIIPVLDSFDMAFSNKEAWEKAPKDWRTGIEYIYSQLMSVLKANGVEEINPIGQNFDHNLHASVETVKVSDKSQDGKILAVVQKGYKLNGRLVREAKVKVGEYEDKN